MSLIGGGGRTRCHSIGSRVRKLNEKLLNLRVGPGAAILPADVKRLQLSLYVATDKGHTGSRRFWRQHLPRLKYHNPAVSMTVTRLPNKSAPPNLSIFFAPAPADSDTTSTSSPAPASSTASGAETEDHTPYDRVESIDVKFRSESEILAKLMEVTKAKELEATVEDREGMRRVEEDQKRTRESQEKSWAEMARVKKEKDMLERVKNAVG